MGDSSPSSAFDCGSSSLSVLGDRCCGATITTVSCDEDESARNIRSDLWCVTAEANNGMVQSKWFLIGLIHAINCYQC